MRALVQRVTEARVRVGGDLIGEIGPGLCVLVGVTHDDTEAAARKLAEKVWHLRVFDDADGVMNAPLGAVGGAVLVVSQFTLYGDTRRGRRPSWAAAAPPEGARAAVDAVVAALRERGASVATGKFGADMRVDSSNDGPFTVLVEI